MNLERIKNKFIGNKVLLNGSLFSIFSFFNQGIGFFLLILLAEYIAPAEYGRLSMFNMTVTFLGFFIALSTQGFLSISYFKRGADCFKKDFSAISTISLTTFVVLILLFTLFHKKRFIPSQKQVLHLLYMLFLKRVLTNTLVTD